MRSLPLAAGLTAAAAAAALAAYLRFLRPRQLRWGATDEEAERAMPGDDIVPAPSFNATRAVTIHAPRQLIWPWLLQVGSGRAGWYSYDWIDNLGRPSAEVIMPDLQKLGPGDILPMSPDGKQGLWVKSLEREKSMLWWDKKGLATWSWELRPIDPEHTRLVTRLRLRYVWTPPSILFNLAVDVGDIVMMRKCLLGIKRRAEKLAADFRDQQKLLEDLLLHAMHSA